MVMRVPVVNGPSVQQQGIGTPYASARAPAGAFGEGLARGLGDVAQVLAQQQEQEEVRWISQVTADARAYWTKNLLERQNSAAPGANGFTHSVSADYGTYARAALENAPSARARDILGIKLNEIGTGVQTDAFQFELKERNSHLAHTARGNIDLGAGVVAADPRQYDAVQQDGWRTLAAMDLPAEMKRELVTYQRKALSSAAIMGEIQRDPAAAARALAGGFGEIAGDAERWRPQVAAASKEFGVPEGLAMAVLSAESAGRPDAVSPAGARGLMQLMPGTAADLGVDPNDPEQNVRGGIQYLGQQLKAFDGNVTHALVAYNWGPGNARKWLDAGGDQASLPAETRAYVEKVLGGQQGAGSIPGMESLTVQERLQLHGLAEREAARRGAEARALYAGEVREFTSLMDGGYNVDGGRLDGLIAQAATAGDAATVRDLTERRALLGFRQEFRQWPDAAQQEWIDRRRTALGDQAHVAPVEAKQLELAEKLHAATVTGLRQDPMSWANEVGVIRLESLAFDDYTSFTRRAAAASVVAERFGTAPQFLTRAEAKGVVAGMVNAPPEQRAMAYRDGVTAWRNAFGTHWPAVYRQLVDAGLPAEAQALLMVDDDPAAGAVMAAMIAAPDLGKSLTPEDRKAISDGLREGLVSFMSSFDPAVQGDVMQAVTAGAERLAVGFRLQGQDADTAVAAALKAMVGGRYQIVEQDGGGAYRVPVTFNSGDVETVAEARLEALTPEMLAAPRDRGEGLTDDQRRRAYADHLRAFGRWATRADDTGLYLLDGNGLPVMSAGGGRVELSFDAAVSMVPAARVEYERESMGRLWNQGRLGSEASMTGVSAFGDPVDLGGAP